MFNKFPQKYSIKWVLVYILSLFISGIIILSAEILAGILLGQELFEFKMFILFFFVAVANLIVCLFGFFNGRYIFLLSGLATLIGTFTSVLLIAEDYSGWEYFSGIMSLVLYLGFGLITGMIVEGVIFINNKKKVTGNNDKKDTKRPSILLILLMLYVILLVFPLVTILINLEPIKI